MAWTQTRLHDFSVYCLWEMLRFEWVFLVLRRFLCGHMECTSKLIVLSVCFVLFFYFFNFISFYWVILFEANGKSISANMVLSKSFGIWVLFCWRILFMPIQSHDFESLSISHRKRTVQSCRKYSRDIINMCVTASWISLKFALKS